MGTVSLNLSRKWRSQNFDQLVGQDLAVRILKNSLYLGHILPVYLFAGQRGCGKTSTARIFAAALNCEELAEFQKNPKESSVPCLACRSCKAMQSGNHPDFIEIDAASHTGVDNMRAIIESSSLLPIMGSKRVYLIDEAHMLSKAAFNAALKILEEPPATAVFILATTNPQKIIETVRSRCFQLFFTPIGHEVLKNHLKAICQKEKIACEDAALDDIVRHTEGSARDALNMLEHVRFSSPVVNKAAVLKVLGYIGDKHIIDIITVVLQGKATDVLRVLHSVEIDNYRAECVWQRLMVILRALVWEKYGVSSERLIANMTLIKEVSRNYSLAQLQQMIEVLYSYEELFVKTTMQHALLEMILLSICQKDKKKTDDGTGSVPCAFPVTEYVDNSSAAEDVVEETIDTEDCASKWERFVQRIVALNHPIITSLFQQSCLIAYDAERNIVQIECPKDLALFKEWVDTTRDVWNPLLKEIFNTVVMLDVHFTGIQTIQKNSKQTDVRVTPQAAPQPGITSRPSTVQQTEKKNQGSSHDQFYGGQQYKKKAPLIISNKETKLDVSNETEWPIAGMLLRHFPGVITEIRENR